MFLVALQRELKLWDLRYEGQRSILEVSVVDEVERVCVYVTVVRCVAMDEHCASWFIRDWWMRGVSCGHFDFSAWVRGSFFRDCSYVT